MIRSKKIVIVTIRFYLKLPFSECTVVHVYTTTLNIYENCIILYFTEIISSYEFTPVVYQQEKGTAWFFKNCRSLYG